MNTEVDKLLLKYFLVYKYLFKTSDIVRKYKN